MGVRFNPRAIGLLIFSAAFSFGAPPATRIAPITETLHGVSLTDPYRWLEDQNSPETRAWITAQMSYTQAALAKVPQRTRIHGRLAELLKVDTSEGPRVRNGRYFILKRRATQDQSILYYRQGADGQDIVLVDPNPLSPDHTMSVDLMDASQDGKLIAYGLRQGGRDETTVRFRNVDTHGDLADTLPTALYFSVSIKPDQSGAYYVKRLEAGPRVFYHAMGTDAARDAVVFGAPFGPTQLGGCEISENGRWLFCQIATGSAGDKVDIYAQDLASSGPMKALVTGIDARFDAAVGGDRMYLLTNWKAPNGRIFAVDLLRPARENWKEIVPERKSVLESLHLAGGRLAAIWLENVHSRVEILTVDGKLLRDLKLPALGVVEGLTGRWQSDEAFYTFSSFGQPKTIYRYSLSSGIQSVWFQQKVPFDPSSVEVHQIWYPSKDGTRVPMFIAHKKGMPLDGSNPVLLTGYGGFNVSETPAASTLALAWMDMGGTYALANLRGGGEFGEAWHKAGMLDKKQNVFDDFIAAAEYLIKEGYTRKERLAIRGGSNGGLLVGAALTQRPDLFRAVICAYPLLDMVRYDQFKVAKFWVPEYGSAQNAEQFKYIYKYSPYQHVEKGTTYPAVLMVSGDGDTRVDPLHARKMAALLQASTGSDHPVLLRYDTQAGHSAGMPMDRQIDETADQLTFLAWQLGMR
jgi:prolyl oligopeptidase